MAVRPEKAAADNASSGDLLPSWNDAASKNAIVAFVDRVTKQGSPDFVPEADRIATFDNDGTLWVEQPLPPQFDFVFRHWAQEIKQDPSLAGEQPYKAVIERDQSLVRSGVGRRNVRPRQRD